MIEPMKTYRIRVMQVDFNTYKAYHGGKLLVQGSCAPFRDSAIALLKDGAKEDDILTAELDGIANYRVLSNKVGKLAGG
jgi:hypothetical protein